MEGATETGRLDLVLDEAHLAHLTVVEADGELADRPAPERLLHPDDDVA